MVSKVDLQDRGGNDAAVRITRAFNGKEKVLFGYRG